MKSPGLFGGVKRLAKLTNKTTGDTKKWLSEQAAYTLHKPARKKYKTRKYKSLGLHHQFQMDLVDMGKLSSFNSGYKWMLTCIDILSRYAWIVPIKSKTPMDVLEGIKKIFREHKPVLLQTDDGKEFFNKLVGEYLKQHNVTHFSVQSQFKAAIVERFHRSIKTRM